MKILIPVDGSDHAKRAVEHLFNYRAVFDLKSRVTLLHVLPSVSKLIAASVRPELIEAHHAADVEKALGWARKRFADSRAEWNELLVTGDPCEKIKEIAETGGYDMIIMGSRGHGAIPGTVLGSTTLKVLSSCAVPVLVVR